MALAVGAVEDDVNGPFTAVVLIGAAQQVTRGNLKVELPIRRGEGDLRRLSMNFNAMTKELERQRTDLVTANTQLTERRRFMEAVLSGVSAGVIGLGASLRPRARPTRDDMRRNSSRSGQLAFSAATCAHSIRAQFFASRRCAFMSPSR